LPEPLVVLKVALEGNVSKEVIMDGLGRGVRPGCDMIPWIVSQQFQEGRFGRMSGARVVRVACHPEYSGVRSFFPPFFFDSISFGLVSFRSSECLSG
jgi:N-acetyltransferase 10